MEHAYQAAHHHEAEDGAEERRPCVEGDRASLRVVSGVASAGCIVGAVGGRCSVLRCVRAVGVRGYICCGGDGSGSLLSRPRPFYSCPYSAECVEEEFSEVHGSKQPSDAAVSTLQLHGGTPSASKRSDLVAVVAPFCIKELRLVTMQLPEKFSSIGPGLKRTSPSRSSQKYAWGFLGN